MYLVLQPATCPFLCRCAITTFPFSSHNPHPSYPQLPPVPHTSSYMPSCRRKRVVLTEPSEALLQAVHSDPHKHVFYLDQTGEIFDTYEYVPFYPLHNTFFLLQILTLSFYQSLFRPNVLLSPETIPVRGNRQKRS